MQSFTIMARVTGAYLTRHNSYVYSGVARPGHNPVLKNSAEKQTDKIKMLIKMKKLIKWARLTGV